MGIFTKPFPLEALPFFTVHVGKYSSPMDPMGKDKSSSSSFPPAASCGHVPAEFNLGTCLGNNSKHVLMP